MKNSIQPIQKMKPTKGLLIFLFSGILLILLSLDIGLANNKFGIIICIEGIISVCLAFSFHWKRMKNYILLLAVSVIVFFLSVFLHNALEAGSQYYHSNSLIAFLFNGLSVAFFLLAVFVCPACVFVGFFGIFKLAFFPIPKPDQ